MVTHYDNDKKKNHRSPFNLKLFVVHVHTIVRHIIRTQKVKKKKKPTAND